MKIKYTYKIVFLFLASLPPTSLQAQNNTLLVGDGNQDGIIDRADSALMMDVLYRGQQVPSNQITALDIDGNGHTDVNDLTTLVQHINDNVAPQRRVVPAITPSIIPRYPSAFWNQSQQSEINKILQSQVSQLFRHRVLLEERQNPRAELFDELNFLIADFNSAVHYGLLAPHQSQILCTDLSTYMHGAGPAYQIVNQWLRERPEGSNYLQRCARALGPTPRRIQFEYFDQCVRGESESLSFSGNADYFISGSPNGRLQVRMPLRLNISPELTQQQRDGFLANWSRASACLRDYWSRYGVEFEFDMNVDDPTALINILPGDGRGNAGNLYVGSTIMSNLCGWAVHEFGHWMGALDDYTEQSYQCPGRTQTPAADSIMFAIYGELQRSRFHSHSLEAMFGSPCGRYNDAPL